jgi:hypothetical protein
MLAQRRQLALRQRPILLGEFRGRVTGHPFILANHPTDRGKPGTRRHLVVHRAGLPLALVLTGANRHDSMALTSVVNAIRPVRQRRGRPRKRPEKLHADKAYDFDRCRRGICAGAASRPASRAAASTAASNSASIAGWSSAPSPGSINSGASPSATNAMPSSTEPSSCSLQLS